MKSIKRKGLTEDESSLCVGRLTAVQCEHESRASRISRATFASLQSVERFVELLSRTKLCKEKLDESKLVQVIEIYKEGCFCRLFGCVRKKWLHWRKFVDGWSREDHDAKRVFSTRV